MYSYNSYNWAWQPLSSWELASITLPISTNVDTIGGTPFDMLQYASLVEFDFGHIAWLSWLFISDSCKIEYSGIYIFIASDYFENMIIPI